MSAEELENLIKTRESEFSGENALFDIRQYGSGWDESYIKANKDGLLLFAVALLKASQQLETMAGQQKIIPLALDPILENGEIDLHYVEPAAAKKNVAALAPPDKETINEKLFKAGCILVIILLIVATFIGLLAMFKWLLQFF